MLSIKVLYSNWPFNLVYSLKMCYNRQLLSIIDAFDFKLISSLPQGFLCLINIRCIIQYNVRPIIHKRRNYWDCKYCSELKEDETDCA